MEHWTVAGLDDERRAEGDGPWREFQRSADLSSGVYVLAAGEPDLQQPHTEDEVYVVVAGSARFVTPTREVAVGPGSVIFVPADEEHRFVDVVEELRVVVVFGPAEGSRG